MKTIVSTKGQIVLPVELRQIDGLRAGHQFAIERLHPGQYLLKKQPAQDNEGAVSWLLNCPEKNWFKPIGSESTDTL